MIDSTLKARSLLDLLSCSKDNLLSCPFNNPFYCLVVRVADSVLSSQEHGHGGYPWGFPKGYLRDCPQDSLFDNCRDYRGGGIECQEEQLSEWKKKNHESTKEDRTD